MGRKSMIFPTVAVEETETTTTDQTQELPPPPNGAPEIVLKNKYYTKKELAKLFSCSIATIDRKIKSGDFRAIKLGLMTRINAQSVADYIARCEQ